jgi:hypothetical protein
MEDTIQELNYQIVHHNNIDSSHYLISILYTCFELYFTHSARSSKKVDYIHNYFVKVIENIVIKNILNYKYHCKTEVKVKSCNSSGNKSCDIVLFKNDIPFIIFPLKLIMTNYKQNKNNYFENLTGEMTHIKWNNTELHIIPINIIFNELPYLNKENIITKFEKIKYDETFIIYEQLVEHKLATTMFNYIINLRHNSNIGDKYLLPEIINFDVNTPFKSFESIILPLLD